MKIFVPLGEDKTSSDRYADDANETDLHGKIRFNLPNPRHPHIYHSFP